MISLLCGSKCSGAALRTESNALRARPPLGHAGGVHHLGRRVGGEAGLELPLLRLLRRGRQGLRAEQRLRRRLPTRRLSGQGKGGGTEGSGTPHAAPPAMAQRDLLRREHWATVVAATAGVGSDPDLLAVGEGGGLDPE